MLCCIVSPVMSSAFVWCKNMYKTDAVFSSMILVFFTDLTFWQKLQAIQITRLYSKHEDACSIECSNGAIYHLNKGIFVFTQNKANNRFVLNTRRHICLFWPQTLVIRWKYFEIPPNTITFFTIRTFYKLWAERLRFWKIATILIYKWNFEWLYVKFVFYA